MPVGDVYSLGSQTHVTEKGLQILSCNGEIKRLGNVAENRERQLCRSLAKLHLYYSPLEKLIKEYQKETEARALIQMNSDEVISSLVANGLHLSVSDEGFLLKEITKMFEHKAQVPEAPKVSAGISL